MNANCPRCGSNLVAPDYDPQAPTLWGHCVECGEAIYSDGPSALPRVPRFAFETFHYPRMGRKEGTK